MCENVLDFGTVYDIQIDSIRLAIVSYSKVQMVSQPKGSIGCVSVCMCVCLFELLFNVQFGWEYFFVFFCLFIQFYVGLSFLKKKKEEEENGKQKDMVRGELRQQPYLVSQNL